MEIGILLVGVSVLSSIVHVLIIRSGIVVSKDIIGIILLKDIPLLRHSLLLNLHIALLKNWVRSPITKGDNRVRIS